MADLTVQDVLRMAKENNVKFIRLQFTDMFGILKNVAITEKQLEKALNNELMFDGSSIEGYVRIEESDMYLRPDPNTFVIYPWTQGEGAEARLICDIYNPDGTPFEGDPRYILKRATQKALDMGYTLNVGPECEFFLFHTDSEGVPTIKTHDKAGYFDMAPVDLGENARRDMVINLEKMGFEVEASHHELAPGQHEIGFKYSEAISAADNIMTFRYVVRVIAQRHGLHASFMPKPVFGIAGSGMHTNMSLSTVDGTNAFYDENGKDGLSQAAYYFMGGIFKHIKGMAAITNPTVNSYKRLVPGYEAPVYIAWSGKNRSPLIRVPAKRGASTRVELRNPDPSCNPYFTMAAALQAGLEGIEKKINPPEPTNVNIYEMTPEERTEAGIDNLPGNLFEAILELEKDDFIKKAMGDHVHPLYLEAKKLEWHNFASRVHQWEVDEYLTKF
ncbi:L-glutamine synthetase [Desulfonispora thiosulfatigenes DSM 11270]|uniref:Glutamine synthetase n=1 Tax=Desulfonispora thiosulfatigenes DSM 11270 TaxID=656914 RepID=A0A1W1V0G8_DESTI|nr:type I glutamate--ammonia ligase [Desulfonispora thiosulfatigenes]SMB86808.1 L-glutamine synthetase [Desulfonispora thiosulfatigenes DSM 11270]